MGWDMVLMGLREGHQRQALGQMPPHNLTSFVKCCASVEDFPPLFEHKFVCFALMTWDAKAHVAFSESEKK